ncbi:hypothetical protein R69658_03645 [Paraburkholderia aspalathi]|uniref:Uncharacterized protein n=1 Tax=Paraburkholderia aspalathi TaxID=1324617 RepID=A0A1I6ZJ74_9BURK|nr:MULTISPECIES: hypothetical protein [Paraburkholderia]MCP2090514.1 hypothetical protein [Paraburkholderia sediminicola]MBK3820236.1 hypothetical protein [Paraburkholderia aspalathi]MBK3832088.1 hypothetical protein [Paraburkholderia aspalathi]MBK3861795.1 hypothetical protein [Paraburkholderia aspalathi]MCX4138645.1 hypothetical protein [Paraburkholderia aspalathi]
MSTKFAFYVCATITSINALVSAAFSLAMVIGQPAVHIAAMYGVARSVPLAIAALIAFAMRSRSGVTVLALLLGSIQACDALVGWFSHDVMKTIGPVTLAALTILSVIFLVRTIRQNSTVPR